jgi:predicted RNA-binding protein
MHLNSNQRKNYKCLIPPEGEKILLTGIFGERELIDAKIKMIDLLHHKIILEKRA